MNRQRVGLFEAYAYCCRICQLEFFLLFWKLKTVLNSNVQTPELEAECDWKEGWRHRWYHKDTLSGWLYPTT